MLTDRECLDIASKWSNSTFVRNAERFLLDYAQELITAYESKLIKKAKIEDEDADIGRIAMKFVDRAGDVHPGIDDAETICADFYKAISDYLYPSDSNKTKGI